jgi:hypothetical protein
MGPVWVPWTAPWASTVKSSVSVRVSVSVGQAVELVWTVAVVSIVPVQWDVLVVGKLAERGVLSLPAKSLAWAVRVMTGGGSFGTV